MPMSPRLLRPIASRGFDIDAQTYITAVESADTQPLELAVKVAINDFVRGCKQDGIWDAIKASCILAGARTLAGALVPLKGAAPTNNGPFVSGDYNRETGLVGNGTSKYLDSNRAASADPQNDYHMAVFGTSYGSANAALLGVGFTQNNVDLLLLLSNGAVRTRSRNITSGDTSQVVAGNSLVGVRRQSSADYTARVGEADQVFTVASNAPLADNLWVYARNSATPSYSNARLAFYSFGESIDLAALDARVSTLITGIGAAI